MFSFHLLIHYSLVYIVINTFGGVAIYVHDSFSFNKLDTVAFIQNSTVYESMYLEISPSTTPRTSITTRTSNAAESPVPVSSPSATTPR